MSDPKASAYTNIDIVWKAPDFKTGALVPGTVKVDVTIQTNYRNLADRTKPSEYGRGKTLGDHEANHRADFEGFVRENPIPQAKFRNGMSLAEYRAEVSRYQMEIDGYIARARAASEQQTHSQGP